MKWKHYLICTILIIVGVVCSIELFRILDIKSGEYGSVFVYEQVNDYEEFSKFDYGIIDFATDDFVNYTSITTYANQDFDGTKNDYLLFFNGRPLNNVVQTAGKISGDLTIKFYDLDGMVIVSAKLNFTVEYLANNTKVTITTQNQDNSISYLNAYMNINGAVLKVVRR